LTPCQGLEPPPAADIRPPGGPGHPDPRVCGLPGPMLAADCRCPGAELTCYSSTIVLLAPDAGRPPMTTPLADPWQAAVSGAILAPRRWASFRSRARTPQPSFRASCPATSSARAGDGPAVDLQLAEGPDAGHAVRRPSVRSRTRPLHRPRRGPTLPLPSPGAWRCTCCARRLPSPTRRRRCRFSASEDARSPGGRQRPWRRHTPGSLAASGEATIVHLPEGRLVILVPAAEAGALNGLLAAHATPAPVDVWTWLGIRAGVPSITTATQDLFVAQTANQDALGAIDFRRVATRGRRLSRARTTSAASRSACTCWLARFLRPCRPRACTRRSSASRPAARWWRARRSLRAAASRSLCCADRGGHRPRGDRRGRRPRDDDRAAALPAPRTTEPRGRVRL